MCCILNPCVGVVNKIIYALHFIGLLSQPPKKQLVAHLILPKTQLVLLEPIVFWQVKMDLHLSFFGWDTSARVFGVYRE